MVSHNLNEIIKNCNRLLVLSKGRLFLYDDIKGNKFYNKFNELINCKRQE